MRMTIAMFKRSAAIVGLMSLLWILSTLMIPSSSHAAIFFDTDFETCEVGTGNDFPCEGWNDFGQERVGFLEASSLPAAAFSGSKGVKGTHNGKFGVGNIPFRPSIYRSTPPNTKHIFARWAFREGSGFEFCAANGYTKLIRFLGTGYPKVWIMNRFGIYSVNVEGPYDYSGTTELMTTNIPVSTSAWQQLEFEWKLNTPGQADGVMRFWVDGVLATERVNRAWIGPTPTSTGLNHPNITPSTLSLDTMQIYMQCGLGTMYYDRIAVGDTRIGPTKSTSASADSTPPASPQGLQAR